MTTFRDDLLTYLRALPWWFWIGLGFMVVSVARYEGRVRTLEEEVSACEERLDEASAPSPSTQSVPNAPPEIRKPLSRKGPNEYHASRSSTLLTRFAESWRSRKSPHRNSYSNPTPLHPAVPACTQTGCANSIPVRICPRTTTYNQRDLYPIGYRHPGARVGPVARPAGETRVKRTKEAAMTKKTTKAELEAQVAELRKQVEELENEVGSERLNGEAIEECRGILAEIGHRATFFTDVVENVCVEVKALRYDQQRLRRYLNSTWRADHPERRKREKPKPDGTEPQAWVAHIGPAV